MTVCEVVLKILALVFRGVQPKILPDGRGRGVEGVSQGALPRLLHTAVEIDGEMPGDTSKPRRGADIPGGAAAGAT